MPEILTESFCERCGTRYTFQSGTRRIARIGTIRVLSTGLKKFVTSDDTSFDEALAAARNERERDLAANQLDAFHKTFNFCMSCRQYTCGNCWNDADGRCLTCAPLAGQEILPAPFPQPGSRGGRNGGETDTVFDAAHVDDDLVWPTTQLRRASVAEHPASTSPGKGEVPGFAARDEETPAPQATPSTDDTAAHAPTGAVGKPAELQETVTDPDLAAVYEAVGDYEAVDEIEAIAALDAPVEGQPAAAAPPEVAGMVQPPMAARSEATSETPEKHGSGWTIGDVAAAASARTAGLLGRFRPGQSGDVEAESAEVAGVSPERGAPEAKAEAEEQPQAARVAERLEAERRAAEAEQQAEAERLEAERLAAEAEHQAQAEAKRVESERVAAEAEAARVAAEAEAERVAAAKGVAAEAERVAAAERLAEAERKEAERLAEAERQEAERVEAEAEAEAERLEQAQRLAAAAAERVAARSERDETLADPERATSAERPPIAAAPAPAVPPSEANRDEDRVKVPAWQMVAPDIPSTDRRAPAEPQAAAAVSGAAQHASTPQWPGTPRRAPESRRFSTSGPSKNPSESLWAASAREVLSALRPGTPSAPAVQTCVSCGLSLSATARFCRRCGTRQD
ncbi:MAG: hypothetical protein H0V87_07230 [Chloroflexi bacterium]|nr:hypothetical protein [Chloroflexota bacterium]